MVPGVFEIFFPKFGVRGALNFDNGPKRYSERQLSQLKARLTPNFRKKITENPVDHGSLTRFRETFRAAIEM